MDASFLKKKIKNQAVTDTDLRFKLHNLELLRKLVELLVNVHHPHWLVRHGSGFRICFLFFLQYKQFRYKQFSSGISQLQFSLSV